jgi:hypothetical protein
VHLGLQSDPYFTTQNQVEVFTTGTLQRARLPLEATIRITPTMQLTNGLPYDVLGWAIAPPHKEAAAGSAAAATSVAAAAAKAAPVNSTLAAAAAAGAMGSEGSETGAPPAAVTGRGSLELQATPGGGAAGAGGRLAGLQQVWAAVSKKEAELALARLVAGGLHDKQPSARYKDCNQCRACTWFDSGEHQAQDRCTQHSMGSLAAQPMGLLVGTDRSQIDPDPRCFTGVALVPCRCWPSLAEGLHSHTTSSSPTSHASWTATQRVCTHIGGSGQSWVQQPAQSQWHTSTTATGVELCRARPGVGWGKSSQVFLQCLAAA